MCSTQINAQYEGLDSLAFLNPVNHPMRFSGNFGELRSNHFHSGLDIKSSEGQVGDPIIAVSDGSVSRVKVQLSGYGHALYIDHPSGYTSVYAHLKSLAPELEKYLNRKQNILESYTVDLYLDPGELRVSKGDTIAYMGNTGRSTGPHLHFEIRDTKSEEPINPFHFGIRNADTRSPIIPSVKLYGLDKNLVQINEKTINVSGKKSATVTIDAWRTALGVLSHDFIDGSWNKNGIYAFQVYVDDSLYFENKFDQFAFHETRYLNASIDYDTKINHGSKYLLAYRKPGNTLSMYQQANNGVIKLYKDRAREVRYVALDFDGNQTEIKLSLKRKAEVSELASKSYNYYIKHNKAYDFKLSDLRIQLPAGTVYQDEFFDISQQNSTETKRFEIARKDIPCHKYYSIAMDISHVPDSIRSKAYIAYSSSKKESIGGQIIGDTLFAKTNKFGTFHLAFDHKPPTLKLLNSTATIKPGDKLKFSLYDDVSSLGYAKEVQWSVFIDGHWQLAPFDLKSKRFYINIPEDLSAGKHVLTVNAVDDRNNRSSIIRHFEINEHME